MPDALIHCPACRAVANPAWETCAACQSPLALAGVVMEPAAAKARPVYWEAAAGQILGPAVPEFLAQVREHFWVVVQYDGAPRWIRSDRLRSKPAFEHQVTPIPFERIREVR